MARWKDDPKIQAATMLFGTFESELRGTDAHGRAHLLMALQLAVREDDPEYLVKSCNEHVQHPFEFAVYAKLKRMFRSATAVTEPLQK